MAIYSAQELRSAAPAKAAAVMAGLQTRQAAAFAAGSISYDIFLSHAFRDSDLVLGLKNRLESSGKTVYVDWIDDHQTDRSQVGPATAMLLRRRMRSCESLVYAFTVNSQNSKWMPWELGYFDGFKPNRVALIPIAVSEGDKSFQGQEYLSIYPVLEKLDFLDGGAGFGIKTGENRGLTLSSFVSRSTQLA